MVVQFNDNQASNLTTAYADTLYTYAHELTKYCLKIMDSEDYVDKEKRFFYTLLFKSVNELESVSVLLKNFFNKPSMQSSMFLILRTMLSDCFTGLYVIKAKEIKIDHLHLIDVIYYDHIGHAIKNIKHTHNQITRQKPAIVERMIQDLKAQYNEYFNFIDNEDGIRTYTDCKLVDCNFSMKKVITFLTQQRLDDKEREMLQLMHYFYDYYSKFEHFGIGTFNIIHKSFNPDAHKHTLKDIIETVRLLHVFMESYLNNWPDLFNENDPVYKNISEKLFRQGDQIWNYFQEPIT